MNATQCHLKLTFRDVVNDPKSGNPDVLFLNLKSKFIFVSEEHRMPLNHTTMNFTLPYQNLLKFNATKSEILETYLEVIGPLF